MGNDPESAGLESVYSKQLLKGLNQLRQRQELCDVELQAGHIRAWAHRVVLSACSGYFKAMFTGNLVETKQSVIHLKGVDESALNVLVDFAYTGKASVTSENVQIILPAANMLGFHKLKEICSAFLLQQLHPSNCVGIYQFAEAYSCPNLLKKSRQYMEDHFTEVIEQQEFFLLPPCQLIDLLRNDNLNVVSEQVVFEAVVSWVKYNTADRASQLANLLGFVRLYLLNIRYLTTCFENNDLVRKDRTSQTLLNEALNYRMKPTKAVTLEKLNPRRAPKHIYALGGKNGLFATLNSAEFYDPNCDRWLEVASMNLRRFEFGAAVLGGKELICKN